MFDLGEARDGLLAPCSRDRHFLVAKAEIVSIGISNRGFEAWLMRQPEKESVQVSHRRIDSNLAQAVAGSSIRRAFQTLLEGDCLFFVEESKVAPTGGGLKSIDGPQN